MSEPAWVLMGPATPAITWEGNWAAGTAYEPGDVVRYQNVDFIAVRPSTGQPPSVASQLAPPGYGTSLPASPVDGQEYILVDSVTAPTYSWRFRYNAGSTSLYKWEFVGGTSWRGAVGSYGASGTAWGGVGVGLTVPRAGIYSVAYGAKAYLSSGTSVVWYLKETVGGAMPTVGDESGLLQVTDTLNRHMGNLSMATTITLTVADIIHLVASASSAAGVATLRTIWLEIFPSRVS